MNKLNIDILYGTARKPKISLFNEKKGVHRSGWGNFEKKTHKFKGPGWSNFEKEIHAINKPLIKFKSKRGIRHSFKLNIKNKSSQLILRMSQKKPFSIKHLRQSAVKLTPYIKIPLYFPVYKRLKHYRMLAPFYGFLWDRVRRERIVNITLGLKRNYSLLLPVFYSSRKYFNITNINHINFES